jgi:hypothetical protein
MPESWFELSSADQSEALEVAAGRSGRPAHLLEKDIWVVWALSAIYDSPLGNTLTFKGGTSLAPVPGSRWPQQGSGQKADSGLGKVDANHRA